MRYSRLLVVAALLTTVAIALIAANIGIYFETNDDVSMMLLAHGIAMTSHPTNLLLFSNRIQGELIGWIGMPFGQPGYSIYMFASLVLGISFLFASLRRLNGNAILSALIIAVLAVRPICAPQFTITASLLMLAAVVVFLDYRQSGDARLLVPAAALGFLGMLMRVDAAAFAFILATPILVRRSSFRLPAIVTATVFAVAAIGAFWWDRIGYLTPAWATFSAVEESRAWFTDYGLGSLLADRAELLHRVGWSRNDLDMFGQWWFFDPAVYTPQRMHELVAAAGMIGSGGVRYELVQTWLLSLINWDTIVVTALALSLAIWRIAKGQFWIAPCLLLCILAFVGFTILGRPGVTRVSYSAMMVLLVLSATASIAIRETRVFIAALSIGLVALVVLFYDNARLMRAQQMLALADMKSLPSDQVIVVWADAWPYQFI